MWKWEAFELQGFETPRFELTYLNDVILTFFRVLWEIKIIYDTISSFK